MAQTNFIGPVVAIQQQQERERLANLPKEALYELAQHEKSLAEAVEGDDGSFIKRHRVIDNFERWVVIAATWSLVEPVDEDKRVENAAREIYKKVAPEMEPVVFPVDNLAKWRRLHRAARRLGHTYAAEQLILKLQELLHTF